MIRIPAAPTPPRPITGTKFSYGEKPSQNLTLFKSSVATSPIVILVHGGWWAAQGHEVEDQGEAEALQKEHFTVVDMNYTEASSGTQTAFPQQPNDIALCVEWAIAHASEINGNANKIVILGGSTGGNISQLAGQRINAAHPGRIKGVCSLSSPMNLVALAAYEIEQNERAKRKEQPFNDSGYGPLATALGIKVAELGTAKAIEEEWSPSKHISSSTSPHLYLCGSTSELIIPVSQQHEMKAAAEAAGVPVTFVETENGHSFAYWVHVSAGIITWIKGF